MTVPPEAVNAAQANDLAKRDLSRGGRHWARVADKQVTRLLEGAYPVICAHLADRMEALAANYPEDLFGPEGTSRDSISGTAMRHAYRNAARDIREGGDDQ